MVKPFLVRNLSLSYRVRLCICGQFEALQALLEVLDALAQVSEVLVVGGSQLADRIGQPGRRLLPPPSHLLAGDLSAAHDVVEQPLCPLPCLGGGAGGDRKGPLHRCPECLADPVRGGGRLGGNLLFGAFFHDPKLSLSEAVGLYRAPAPVPVHLRPSAPTAADALLCGDPSRALAIAQRVLVKPRMSNHHRGLWGYFGHTGAGRELTVQATGIGGPSAVAVVGELVELGLRRAIRIGTCTAPGVTPAAGSKLVVDHALALDGTSAALGFAPGSEIGPDPGLTAALLSQSRLQSAVVSSSDVHRGAELHPELAPLEDLQTAALFALSSRGGFAAAAALVVASAGGRRLEDEPLEAALIQLAAAGVAALEVSSSS